MLFQHLYVPYRFNSAVTDVQTTLAMGNNTRFVLVKIWMIPSGDGIIHLV